MYTGCHYIFALSFNVLSTQQFDCSSIVFHTADSARDESIHSTTSLSLLPKITVRSNVFQRIDIKSCFTYKLENKQTGFVKVHSAETYTLLRGCYYYYDSKTCAIAELRSYTKSYNEYWSNQPLPRFSRSPPRKSWPVSLSAFHTVSSRQWTSASLDKVSPLKVNDSFQTGLQS
jgi:hypothetical protein